MKRRNYYDPELIIGRMETENRRRESAIKNYERQKAYKEQQELKTKQQSTERIDTLTR